MRTTLIIKPELLEEAMRLTQVKEKTELVHLGLKALIEQKSRERLAALGGVDPRAQAMTRSKRQLKTK